MTTFLSKRASGILAHITSLPSPYGIGDIGYSAYSFLNFLHDGGQSIWQFLPTGPTNPVFDNSPYMSTSAFAGSPLLISLELLVEKKLIDQSALDQAPQFSEYLTDYSAVTQFKNSILQQAFTRFDQSAPDFLQFVKKTSWLRDYCLFMVLKEEYAQKGWFDWPSDLAGHQLSALEEKEKLHAARIAYYSFEQFTFNWQWQKLRQKAREKGIRLIGDIPIYMGWDSVDVWVNQSIFFLNSTTHHPTQVAGVPPDYFSKTGQRWGNPLYRWNSDEQTIHKQLYTWWTGRFRAVFEAVDIARVDHFRGFEAYWSIPGTHKTAMNGKWVKGPGIGFFEEIYQALGPLEIIAEDLGDITPEVIALRKSLGFPGMKILQFAFDGNKENSFLPYNFTTPNNVIYTGTHDNDTTVGWYLSDKLNDSQRKAIRQICNRTLEDDNEIYKDIIHLALSSISRLAIFPLQDILGFGSDCKMNSPGSKKGNWSWRCAPRFLNTEISNWLHELCDQFGRIPEKMSVTTEKQGETKNA
ncbi:MAG: 4-alpha-glucanotransferase [Proteobacteria bacterium]|nr:4-alpha-glucanotransferase [Pseudomonadota bacterium]MBU1057975.1 4-alpha-glucanotransferase [Pseudomonadota bacterium]